MSDFRALFMVLSDPDKTEQVLDILLQCEIRGATIIDSLGMGQIMASNVPVFGTLRSLLSKQHENNQTIFAVSEHPEKIDKAIEIVSKEFDDFQEPCSGMIFVVPVLKVVGVGTKRFQNNGEQD